MAEQPYTPTTEQWRENSKLGLDGYTEGDATDLFDAWLAAHDAQVLRDAALSGDLGTTAQSTLLRRADRIARGTSA